jgi:hypothetical protein
MNESLNYAQVLRTIGQMPEGLIIQSLELKIEGEDLTVSASKARQRRQPAREKSLRVFWERLRGTGARTDKPSSGVVELYYTAADIDRMDSEGRARRGHTAGTPEPHSLSQVLRAVGAFVDQQHGHLLTVRKENLDIGLEYDSKLKGKISQQFTVASLYDYWVKMYLNRHDRCGAKN